MFPGLIALAFNWFQMTEDSNFDRLLKKYMDDRVSQKERIRLEAWLDADKTGADKGFVWKKQDARMLFRGIAANIDSVDKGPASGRSHTARSGICRWLKIAASLLLLVSGYCSLWSLVGERFHEGREMARYDIKDMKQLTTDRAKANNFVCDR